MAAPVAWQARYSLIASALVSALGYKATVYLIPIIKQLTLKRGMYGAPAYPGHHHIPAPAGPSHAPPGCQHWHWPRGHVPPRVSPIVCFRVPTGLDINKKGTEAGEKKVPESLGLAPGVVFLVRLLGPKALKT